MNNISLLKKYNNIDSSNHVLGALLNTPKLFNNKSYPLSVDDFIVKTHKDLFITINNLIASGLNSISMADIESYLNNNNKIIYNLFFNNSNNFDWLSMLFEEGEETNYDYYYNDLRKYTLLRTYIANGIDVSEILDLSQVDIGNLQLQQDKFNNTSIKDIINFFDNKYRTIRFSFNENKDREFRKSGDEVREILKELQSGLRYGLNTEMPVLTELTGGFSSGNFVLLTLPTGVGKTRNAIKKLVNVCSPLLWDFDKKEFIRNPNGDFNAGLYIGNEMDIKRELEPMILAFISGVPEKKIKSGDLTEDEKDRLEVAIQCSEKMQLHLEYNDNYDIQFFKDTIDEYYNKYENTPYSLRMVVIDYLELTGALINEYSFISKGASFREDMILLNLSKEIKTLAKVYGLTIVGYTQTTGEAVTMGYRDFRAIKGGKAIPNKADVGMICFPPTSKETALLKPLVEKSKRRKMPNIGFNIYKNRFGSSDKNNIKIWAYQELGIGKYTFLFATDEFYQPITLEGITVNFRDEEITV